uniref:Uncharacterized protein n=1 Tax=Anguilla anguilla TaxID=7936 RepID=A0A0E9VBH1_ANGAN
MDLLQTNALCTLLKAMRNLKCWRSLLGISANWECPRSFLFPHSLL